MAKIILTTNDSPKLRVLFAGLKNQMEIVKLEGGGDFRWVEITKSASSC